MLPQLLATRHRAPLLLALSVLAACALHCRSHPLFDDTHALNEGTGICASSSSSASFILLNDFIYADASARLALELEREILDIAYSLKEADAEELQRCSSGDGHVDLVISAAMTPPYPYGYGPEYVARWGSLLLLLNSPFEPFTVHAAAAAITSLSGILFQVCRVAQGERF